MASKLIACKTCNQEMSNGAKTCPKCGEPNKKYEGSITKFIKGCVWVFIVLMFLGFLIGIMAPGSPHNNTSVPAVAALTPEEGMALSECKYQVTKHLGLAGQSGTLPDSRNFSSKGEFQFSWPRGSFSIDSPLGNARPSASCGGKLKPLKVEWITINGEDYKPFKA